MSANLRTIKALPLPSVKPNLVPSWRPEFLWVDPRSLLVEKSYQRDFGENSHRLIRRIVGGWDWSAMKAPICARLADGSLVIIDGQHTAIAAASHPDIDLIPIMVVEATTLPNRATSFVKHNSDRIAMAPMQVHHAALVAGDEVAVAMMEACRKAGATILRTPPSHGSFQVGETVAVACIRAITSARGVNFMARVLRILVGAKRAPVGTNEIKAVSGLLSEAEWKGDISDDDLTTLIRSKSPRDWQAHADTYVRRGTKIPISRAIAVDWFRNAPKRRKVA